MVIFAIAVGLSKYGKIKLGHDDDKPKFSNFSWFAQLFGGGMGIGLVFWSVAEPLSDYMAPPSAGPETAEAMHEAMQTVFFHWGISPWVIFVFGGAVFICNILVTDLGGYLQNFIHKSLWMENADFVQGWTVFYWAWWIAWAPFCGQFVARTRRLWAEGPAFPAAAPSASTCSPSCSCPLASA